MSNEQLHGLQASLFSPGCEAVLSPPHCHIPAFVRIVGLFLSPVGSAKGQREPNEAESETNVSGEWLWECSGFIVSFAAHMAMILVLGLIVTPTKQRAAIVTIISHPSTEDTAIDFSPVEIKDVSSEQPMPCGVQADAEVACSGIDLANFLEPDLDLPNAEFIELPASEADLDLAMPDAGSLLTGIGEDRDERHAEAMGAEVSFYGVKASGRRFVFVTDCSSSMQGQSLQLLKEQLRKTIGALPAKAEFYIVFFNDKAIPMASSTCVQATPQQLRTHLAWVDQVQSAGGTDPSEAMRVALALEPSVVFLLTDGMFPPEPTEAVIRGLNKNRTIRINTIAIGERGAEPGLRRIATENKGTYTFVSKE